MSITLNEIKQRAIEFSNEWKDETRERAEAKSFWDGFFNVFGISRRRVASFEQRIDLGNGLGFIDLFWKGKLIVEHKSRGKSLDSAYSQALNYFNGLKEDELPKYILVSDFEKFRLYDLDENKQFNFTLKELYRKIHLFSFITGYNKIDIHEESVVDINAGKLIGELHDSLKDNGYKDHDLELLLVRLLFCLFADDTSIWKKGHFEYYIKHKTSDDGSDLGAHLNTLFETLNTDETKRQKNIDETLDLFTYINGGLFKERLSTPFFDRKSRDILLKCCNFNWGEISPVVFGSIFQSSMDKSKRGNLGAHYTSESDILKILNPLFLESFYEEFEKYKNDHNKLKMLLNKISKLKILDPACGCGNFLVLAYRELRRLDLKIRVRIYTINNMDESYIQGQIIHETNFTNMIDVDAMYGFEIDELAVLITQVALWLVDHQMNMLLSEELGLPYTRIPLRTIANIHHINALRVDWNDYISKYELNYIVGNPPFVSKQDRDEEQRKDMDLVFKGIKKYGILDYVCAWYKKSSEFIVDTEIEVAFVSTNSIVQGEQTEILYNSSLKNTTINFAHRSFKWNNGLPNAAQVFVIIICFSYKPRSKKNLYDYATPTSSPNKLDCKNINIYLVNGDNIVIKSSRKRLDLDNTPLATFGSMPNDGGHLILKQHERDEIIRLCKDANKYIKPLISAKELINGDLRWCIWIEEKDLPNIKNIKPIKERIQLVKEHRINSDREATKRLAEYPYLFGEIRQPKDTYIVIPNHSSEGRKYIPIELFSKDSIVNNSCIAIHSNELYIMGILMSCMHMTWIKQFAGRIKGDYRYSVQLCYNTYPFPDLNDIQKKDISKAVQKILEIRKSYSSSTLADLYSPTFMPKNLNEAHKKLDRLVEKAYSPRKRLDTDSKRLDVLLESYIDKINVKPKDTKHSRYRKVEYAD